MEGVDKDMMGEGDMARSPGGDEPAAKQVTGRSRKRGDRGDKTRDADETGEAGNRTKEAEKQLRKRLTR